MLKLNWTGDVDEANYEHIVKQITEELNSGEQTLDVELTINCSAGNLIDAFAFFDFIRLNNIQLTTFGLGRLYLPAITILLSGQERKASLNSVFIAEPVENYLGLGLGSPHPTLTELHEALNGLEHQIDHIHEVFAKQCGDRDKSDFEKLFSQNRIFNAEHAQNLGIIQEIV